MVRRIDVGLVKEEAIAVSIVASDSSHHRQRIRQATP
jgi:hypothetical protein